MADGQETKATELGGSAGRLYLGDALQVMPGMPDCSVDAVVTDPP
jgi:DNA modification methylase